MIQDVITREVHELKLVGYMLVEVHAELAKRHKKAPTIKTVRKYYNMDCVPEGICAKLRKQIAFDCEPFRSAIVEIVNLNPDCYMSSAHQEDGGFAHGKQALGESVKRHALPNMKTCDARPESFDAIH